MTGGEGSKRPGYLTHGGDEGPREKLLRRGSRALSDGELLAVLLRTGREGQSARSLASDLLSRYRGLREMMGQSVQLLLQEPGIGPAKLSTLLAGVELGRRCAEQRLGKQDVMASPAHTRDFLQHHFATRTREVFCCLFLDTQHRLLDHSDLFLGSLDGAAVYPRVVVEAALRQHAAAVILAHNHPSGVTTPSASDRRITERLQRALALIDVRVLDHIVVGRGECFSFAEAGFL